MGSTSGTTTTTAGGLGMSSTEKAGATRPRTVRLGQTVVVRLDEDLWRPMLITSGTMDGEQRLRLSGSIHCQPEDRTSVGCRGWASGISRIVGDLGPTNLLMQGVDLLPGGGIGQWQTEEAQTWRW